METLLYDRILVSLAQPRAVMSEQLSVTSDSLILECDRITQDVIDFIKQSPAFKDSQAY